MARFGTGAGIAALALACSTQARAANADDIWFGGLIVTVNDAAPSAEAVAVKAGRIVAVGSKAAVLKAEQGKSTRLHNLAGRTMTPGFIDPHSHFTMSLAMASRVNIGPPPAGPARTLDDIIAALRRFATDHKIGRGDLIVGFGYDGNLMPPGQQLSRDVLDKAFPDNPVVILHVSMHGALLNSAAFAKIGYRDGMATPPGGIIQRSPGTQDLQGLVMEAAYVPVLALIPPVAPETELAAARAGQMIYAAAGITTMQDGATHAGELAQLQRIAAADGLFLDLVAYPFMTDVDAALAKNPARNWGSYSHGLKIGGCKIVVDGSPQAKTAWFTTPYLTGGPNGEANWTGGPVAPPELMAGIVRKCYDNGLPVMMHANGDAAIDFLLKAHEDASATDPGKDRRTIAIHAQFARPDQIARFKADNIIPSFFAEHTFFFYDAHKVNRGVAQAGQISPMKRAYDAGLRPTNHTDYAVAPINQLFTIWAAVNRRSRSGEAVGPDQRITPLQALKAITINAAYQYREEADKGSIEPGKRADLVILGGNPLTVPADAIKDIAVLETIKDGKTVFRAIR